MYFPDDCENLFVDEHFNRIAGEVIDSDTGIDSKQLLAPKCEGKDYASKSQGIVALEVRWLGMNGTSSIDKGKEELYVGAFAKERKAENIPAM